MPGAVVFRALFMGGYDSSKYLMDIEHSLFWRAVAAQVTECRLLATPA